MKQIPNFPEYFITMDGEIFSCITNRWLKPLDNGRGYKQVSLRKNNKSFKTYIHRLVLKTYKGISDLDCNHINGDKANNSIENLEYCTRKRNIQHAIKHGLRYQPDNSGEKHHKSKLTEKDVVKIREEQKIDTKTLAQKYNVNVSTINRARRGETWKKLK